MDSRDEQIKKHQEKWKRWQNQLLKKDNHPHPQAMKEGQSPYNYAVNLIQKLDSSEQVNIKNNVQKFEEQLESNACYVCMQLMVPPKKPIILFPCSHNICKLCLFVDGQSRKKQSNYQLKLKKCPICKQAILNHAQNRNLMTLICTYTDNKHLLQKQLQMQAHQKLSGYDAQKQANIENIEKVRIRCSIMDNQRRSLDVLLTKDQKQLTILQKAIKKLDEQKKRNSQELQELREESKLIAQFLKQKQQQLQKIQENIQLAEQKKKIAEKTLQPLRIQRQKMQILQAAKQMGA